MYSNFLPVSNSVRGRSHSTWIRTHKTVIAGALLALNESSIRSALSLVRNLDISISGPGKSICVTDRRNCDSTADRRDSESDSATLTIPFQPFADFWLKILVLSSRPLRNYKKLMGIYTFFVAIRKCKKFWDIWRIEFSGCFPNANSRCLQKTSPYVTLASIAWLVPGTKISAFHTEIITLFWCSQRHKFWISQWDTLHPTQLH